MRRILDLLRRRRGDRGATVPEYALGVALIAVLLIATVQSVTDTGSERLEGSDTRIGVPVDQAVYGGSGTTTPTTGGATTSSTTSLIPLSISGLVPTPTGSGQCPSSVGFCPNEQTSKWDAYVTITVVNATGQPVEGVTVVGLYDSAGSQAQNTSTCDTNVDGQCILINRGINDNDPSVVVTIQSMTKAGYTFVSANQSATASCPDPSCD